MEKKGGRGEKKSDRADNYLSQKKFQHFFKKRGESLGIDFLFLRKHKKSLVK